eukprot:m.5852 g.5852  ORF g.5852 m.5852 type:complete len:74 (+) comp7997_c0_seq2:374-595(+)
MMDCLQVPVQPRELNKPYPKEENEHLSRILDFLLKYGLELFKSLEDGNAAGLLLKRLPSPRQPSGLEHFGLLL